MFRNTMWYLEHLPKGSKVIVWTASVHAARQRGSLASIPLGTLLAERLGDRVASVAFTALGGQSSMAGRPSRPLPELPSGSLEALSTGDGAAYRVLDREALRAAGVVPSRLLGRIGSADWSTMFDMVVVVRVEVAPGFAR
jgi:erythromycin esterase-like protein